MTRVKLDLRATGTGNVELNGVDVSTAVAGVTVNANVGDMTSVLIRLPAAAVTMDGVARVKLAPQVREMLVAAGWTPPGPPEMLVTFPPGITPEEIVRFGEEFHKSTRRAIPHTDDLGNSLHAEDVDGS